MKAQSKEFYDTIDSANARGVGQFHVFCDEPFCVGGVHTGKHIYHSSWKSLDIAKVVANKNDEGVVYNSFGDVVS